MHVGVRPQLTQCGTELRQSGSTRGSGVGHDKSPVGFSGEEKAGCYEFTGHAGIGDGGVSTCAFVVMVPALIALITPASVVKVDWMKAETPVNIAVIWAAVSVIGVPVDGTQLNVVDGEDAAIVAAPWRSPIAAGVVEHSTLTPDATVTLMPPFMMALCLALA
jgi:hypothetical protein